MDPVTAIGATGAGLILIGFVLNQIGKLSTEDLSYDVINLIGGGLLLYYSWLLASIPFFVLNLVWFGVSLKDVITTLRNGTIEKAREIE